LSVVAGRSGCRSVSFSFPCTYVGCMSSCSGHFGVGSLKVKTHSPRDSTGFLSPGRCSEGSSMRDALLTTECCHWFVHSSTMSYSSACNLVHIGDLLLVVDIVLIGMLVLMVYYTGIEVEQCIVPSTCLADVDDLYWTVRSLDFLCQSV